MKRKSKYHKFETTLGSGFTQKLMGGLIMFLLGLNITVAAGTLVERPGEEPCDGRTVNNLACNDDVIVPLEEGCAVLITPDLVLEGTICDEWTDDLFLIRVVGDDEDEERETEDNIADGPGRYIVEIQPRDPQTFPIAGWQGCWGYITVEDKNPPRAVNEYASELSKVKRSIRAQTLDGKIGLANNQGLINIAAYSCFIEDSPYASCDRPYKTVTFKVDKTDVYTLELDIDADEDGMLAVYRLGFDPENPCGNIIHHSNERSEYADDVFPGPGGAHDGLARLVMPLTAEDTYVALITYDDCVDDNDLDDFRLTLYSDGPGLATVGFGEERDVEICRDLLCTDVSFVKGITASARWLVNAESGAGPPEFADCSLERVWFEDGALVEDGDCGEIYFYRTWQAIDRSGLRARPIRQKVVFRLPSLSDVFTPAKTVPIECDEMQGVLLDDNGRPSPAFSGYPFIVSGFGIHDLNETYCNLGASYRDISEIENCGDGVTIVREWTLIDWCYVPGQDRLNNGAPYNYRQIIRIGDFSPPTLSGLDDLRIPTGPFSCQGVLKIPIPQVEDNCSEYEVAATVYRILERPLYTPYGRPTGRTEIVEEEKYKGSAGDIVPNLEPGYTYKIRYTAVDECGNKSEVLEIEATAFDDTEPVAICNDNLHVSVGGEGIGRVTAREVDEGSWDNCGEVALYASRKLADSNLRDQYLQQIYNLAMSDLIRSMVETPEGPMEVWKNRSNNVEVLRKKDNMWYTWWAGEVYFVCDDIGANVTIELLVIDGDGALGSYLNGDANANICWLEVKVEDKIRPYCIAPANVMMTCLELPYGFNPQDDAQLETLFGAPGVVDNCSGGAARQMDKTIDWECGSGSIVRIFRAVDGQGQESVNTCRQEIIVGRVHDYEIKFPKDAQTDCSKPSPDTIVVTEIGCDLLTVNVVDERYDVAPGSDACYKIKRTYKVINWCEYTGEAPPVVVGRNEDCDGEIGEDDVYVLVRTDGATYFDQDNNERANPSRSPCQNVARGHLKNSRSNPEITSVGYWQYTQFIKVKDTSRPEIRFNLQDGMFCSLNNEDCSAEARIPVAVADVCGAEELTIKLFLFPDPLSGLSAKIDLQDPANRRAFRFRFEGTYPFFEAVGRFPLGDHTLEVHAVDACGNSGKASVDFSVVDCKAPSPICINGLSVKLSRLEAGTDADGDGDEDNGAVAVWASDFKVSALEDCSGPVKLSINRVGERPDPSQTGLVLTCDDLDTVAVEIYAWDAAYNPEAIQPDGVIGGPNYDFCLTYVIVQDNLFNLCNPPRGAGIAGLLMTEEGETLENAEIHLSGAMNNLKLTSRNGHYAFTELPVGYDYSIASAKGGDYLNGVSTYDLVLITKHILRTETLDSPYQLIAADVNNSGSVTALDLIHLRKLILSVATKFPGNTSWRFVPTAYRFPQATNPWYEDFPEVINYNNLKNLRTDGDFVAIKIGDVSGNAKANSLSTETRSPAGLFHLWVEDQELRAGGDYQVRFAAELAQVQGYQFTLNFDAEALELTDMDYGIATEENFGLVFLEEGCITTSWNAAGPVAADPGKPQGLFTLAFRAKTDGRLSDLLKISSRYTRAEAYDALGEILDVDLRFARNPEHAASFELYQNQPNPFGERTAIGFYLPEDGEATLTIRDVSGRILQVIKAAYERGYRQIALRRNELPVWLTNGSLLYYTLETRDHVATRKMILIKD